MLEPDDVYALLKLVGIVQEPKHIQSFRASLARRTQFTMGVFFNGILVAKGGCCAQFASIGLPCQWATSDFVHPDLRHRGIGKFMHRERLKEAHGRGINTVFVSVSENNHASQCACKAVGFVEYHAPKWSKIIRKCLLRNGFSPPRQLILIHRFELMHHIFRS